MAKKWIAAMHMKKGALHKQLGVKDSEKTPLGMLVKASKAKGKLGKRARLAMTLKRLRKKKRS